MPNWCLNYLQIEGTKEDLDEFEGKLWTKDNYNEKLEALRKKALNGSVFQRIRKARMYRDILKLGTCPGLFDATMFCYWEQNSEEIWGTRTDPPVDEEFIRVSEIFIEFRFDTAWSPPLKWLARMAIKFPSLEITLAYYEGGNSIAGYAETKNRKMQNYPARTAEDFDNIGEMYFNIVYDEP